MSENSTTREDRIREELEAEGFGLLVGHRGPQHLDPRAEH
jgi:hypothetical protein